MNETDLITGPLPGPEETKDEPELPKKRGRPLGSVSKKRLETLETELEERIREYIAVPIGMLSPLGCYVLDQRAERTAKALTRIAATSPRMRKALERFVAGSAMVDLGGTMIAVTIAIGVDLHRIEPGSMPARFAGVQEAWPIVYPGEMYWSHSNGNNPDLEMRGSFFESEE